MLGSGNKWGKHPGPVLQKKKEMEKEDQEEEMILQLPMVFFIRAWNCPGLGKTRVLRNKIHFQKDNSNCC